MPTSGAPDAQHGVLATLGLGKHTAGVGGEHRGQEGTWDTEEQEEPLGHTCVIRGDVEGVGDVVQQVVRTVSSRDDVTADPFGFEAGRARIGVEQTALHGDVDLADRRSLDAGLPGGGCAVESRLDDRSEGSW